MGCDSRYLEPLLAMQERGYQTCLVYATGNVTKDIVIDAPIPKLKWVEEVLERAPYVNPLNHDLGHYRGDYNFEPVSPLITCPPSGDFVAIAIGYELKVYNLREDRPVSLKDGPSLTDSILALTFSASSQLLACGGNDKQFTVWSAKSWKCLGIINVLRGAVAVAVTHDDSHVCYANKLGCVYVLKLDGLINNGEVSHPTLVKFDNSSCIITTLGFSPTDDYMLCSNDDFSINVITFKKEPLEELHQVESYCLGHTGFITCSTFVHAQYLISGSYDGTIRLWKMPQGLLCYTLDPLMEGGHITDVCSIPNSSLVAVGVSTYSGIHILRYDVESCLLSVTNVLHEDNFIPTSISAGEPGVWMVTGASYPPSARQSGVVRVKVVSLPERVILGDLQIPCETKLLQSLQTDDGSTDVEVRWVAENAIQVGEATLLRKKANRQNILEKQILLSAVSKQLA